VVCALGAEVRRCHDCRARQAWFRATGFLLPTKGVTRGRLVSLVLIGSSFLVCLVFIWWMIARFKELAG
jgi:hypothetical protein